MTPPWSSSWLPVPTSMPWTAMAVASERLLHKSVGISDIGIHFPGNPQQLPRHDTISVGRERSRDGVGLVKKPGPSWKGVHLLNLGRVFIE